MAMQSFSSSWLIGGVGFILSAMLFWCTFKSKTMLKQMQNKLSNLAVEIKRINHHLTLLQSYVDDGRVEEEIDETKIYVGNIDYAASEAELAAHFAKFGHIETVNIPVDRHTGKARGFGFITFKRVADAMRAMDLDGSEFKGRQIQVNFARERATA
jgi:RNA recognition motif-containing protein